MVDEDVEEIGTMPEGNTCYCGKDVFEIWVLSQFIGSRL